MDLTPALSQATRGAAMRRPYQAVVVPSLLALSALLAFLPFFFFGAGAAGAAGVEGSSMVRLNVSCTLVPTASLNCHRMNQIHRESASLLVPCQNELYKEVTTASAAEKDSWCNGQSVAPCRRGSWTCRGSPSWAGCSCPPVTDTVTPRSMNVRLTSQDRDQVPSANMLEDVDLRTAPPPPPKKEGRRSRQSLTGLSLAC